MSKAIVVIDVQNYFAVENAAGLPEKIASHIRNNKYDHLIFTLFNDKPGSNFRRILGWQASTTSPDIDLHESLEEFSRPDNTFKKSTYSAFKAPDFVKYLDKQDVTELDICGINIDGCVLATAYDAFDLGYMVKILEDLSSVSSFRQDYVDSAKTIIARNLKRKVKGPTPNP